MKIWSLPKGETRSVRLDPGIKVTSLPYWPSDRDWDAHYAKRVAQNVARRPETCIFLREQV